MIAKLRQYRTSPKKVNLVACLIRKKPVSEALDILTFTNKKSAPVLKKLLESAISNAENNFKQSKEKLYVKEVLVSEGTTYKRSVPISRGRVHPILKRSSHISITLSSNEEAEANVEKDAKVEKKSEAKVKTAEKKTVKKELKTEKKTTKSK